jgi:predicted Abi (CAAX) family protease
MKHTSTFNVTISEILQKTVTVVADSPDDAEQLASDNWRAGDYILGAEDFTGVDFKAVPMPL